MCVLSRFSRVFRLFATLWIIAHQTSPSMGFSREEYWGGLLCPSPGDFPNPGIKLMSPMTPELQTVVYFLFLFFFNTEPPGNPEIIMAGFKYDRTGDLTRG